MCLLFSIYTFLIHNLLFVSLEGQPGVGSILQSIEAHFCHKREKKMLDNSGQKKKKSLNYEKVKIMKHITSIFYNYYI